MFTKDNSEVKLAVRRFDEVLAEKASKLDLHGLEMILRYEYVKVKDYQGKIASVQETLEEALAKVRDVEENLVVFEKTFSAQISGAVRKSLEIQMKNYEHLLEDFRKLFGDDTFSAVMDKKVDQLEFHEITAAKANKVDLNSCFSCLESLH